MPIGRQPLLTPPREHIKTEVNLARSCAFFLRRRMRFSGYMFDVEGTLVDSVQQNLLSLQVCLADFGISVP